MATSSSSSSIDSSSSSSIDSSSSSSIDSSSSSSSIDSSSSSIDSSSSSSSSIDSSSSSSIDSSSSSSSIDSSSSSSSSSLQEWNKSKPLILTTSAIQGTGALNQLAQAIFFDDDTISIGKVFIYLYGPFGILTGYTIFLDIYTCSDDGRPLTSIASDSILGSSVTSNGWYQFDFSLSNFDVPVNGYLAFVMKQVGGTENDYVSWGYGSVNNTENHRAWLSSTDGASWGIQKNIIRSLNVVGNFNPYDLTDFQLETPPSVETTITQLLTDATNASHDTTVFTSGDYTETVTIDYPNAIVSFILDSSGSMGWNDRFNTRITFVERFINRMKLYYPATILFDMIKFGSRITDLTSVLDNLGQTLTINLDLENPSRTTYIFDISAANSSSQAIYENNGLQFTVSQTISGITSLITTGTADPLIDAGTLTKISGTGDASIVFSSFTKAVVSDRMIAYGLKNLEDGHLYNVGEVQVDNEQLDGVATDPDAWQLFYEIGENPGIFAAQNGSSNTASIDILASANSVARKTFHGSILTTTNVTSDVLKGNNTLSVSDSGWLRVGTLVDVTDASHTSVGHSYISNSSSTSLTVDPVLVFDIEGAAGGGKGILHETVQDSFRILDGTTIMLFVRDVAASQLITFYLQNELGYLIEYDFMAHTDWNVHNIYWLDETAIIPIQMFDSDGDPFPDGTKITFYVNQQPNFTDTALEIPSQLFAADASIGETKIYLQSTVGFSVGLKVDILDNNNFQGGVTIIEVGSDVGGKFIRIDTPLTFGFTIANGAKVVPSKTEELIVVEDARLPIKLPVVDITPAFIGTNLDPSLLAPYDLTPVSPSVDYDDLNTDREFIQFGIHDIPSISGYGAIRILPITEDNVKTLREKEEETERLVKSLPEQGVLSQLEETEGDARNFTDISDFTTTTTTGLVSKGKDFVIENPVFLESGVASTSMETFATELTEKTFTGMIFPGINTNPPSLLTKSYTIYPVALIETTTNALLARQFFKEFEIDFAMPVFIESKFTGQSIPYYVPDWVSGCKNINLKGYKIKNVNGVYASPDFDTSESFTISYVITDKGALVKDGTLQIKIFSNKVTDLDKSAEKLDDSSAQFLNVKLPSTTTIIDGETVQIEQQTSIDEWINAVESNPYGEFVESEKTNVPAPSYNSEFLKAVFQQTGQSFNLPTVSSETQTTNANFYTDAQEWTKANQYGDLQEATISVINGIATLTVPVSNEIALIKVQASFNFGENDKFSAIRSDLIFVSNPIDIVPFNPFQIFVEDGEKYEVGNQILWKGQNVIEDGTIVNYIPPRTNAEPSASQTNNGFSGGIFLGPRQQKLMTCPKPSDVQDCECHGEFEEIEVEVTHSSGFVRKAKRLLEWTGPLPDTEEPLQNIFFFVSEDSTPSWADGTLEPNSGFSVDLDDLSQLAMPNMTQDIINKLRGQDQPSDQPRTVISSRGNPNRTQWGSEPISWIPNFNTNKNIGHIQPEDPLTGIFFENPPWKIHSQIYTNFVGSDNRFRIADGTITNPIPDIITGLFSATNPSFYFREPLGITLSVESYNGEFTRDGVDSVTIVADITWRGRFITTDFIANEGMDNETTIEFPMPRVTFEAGTCGKTNSDGGNPAQLLDVRNVLSGCIQVNDNAEAKLTDYSVVSELSRTSIDSHASGTHTHSVTLNSNGDGQTTSTIVLSGTPIADHTHTITNYIVQAESGHSHSGLRSVATTTLLSTSDIKTNFVINGYVRYDPTVVPFSGASHPDGNRMMFASVYLSGTTITRGNLVVDLTAYYDARTGPEIFSISSESEINTNVSSQTLLTGPILYASKTIDDTSKAFDIVSNVYFKEHTREENGNIISVPRRNIDDGSRIVYEIRAYDSQTLKDEEQGNKSILNVSENLVRSYISLQIKASISSEGQYAEVTIPIQIAATTNWLPFVKALFDLPSSDTFDINNSLEQIEAVGASQIHDAVKLSANNLIDYEFENSTFANYEKTIILLTDGDENTSEASIRQAINTVNIVDGAKEVPLIALRLGYAYASDDMLMQVYAIDTGGNNYFLINATESSIDDVIDDILTNQNVVNFNSGTYSNLLVFQETKMPKTLTLNNFTLPTGSRILFRYRTGIDGVQFSSWSDWLDSSETAEFVLELDSLIQFLEYQIFLIGNEFFEGPTLTTGITFNYFDPSSFTTFFVPIDVDINGDEFVSSIHITHTATTLPATSTIDYGFTQSDSTNPEDYFGPTRPLITTNRHTILLTRYNELLLTDDFRTYKAINGRWHPDAVIEVYKKNSDITNGQLIGPSEYAFNHTEGTITFYNTQSELDSFLLNIELGPSFRIICNVVNYGSEAAIIDHIGVMYNIMKRIPRDINGSIIHSNIAERI